MKTNKKNLKKKDETKTVSLTIPNDLKLNPFFAKIISLDAMDLFSFSIEALKAFGYEEIVNYPHSTEGYIFARGSLPVCLVAHMDKVPRYSLIEKIDKRAVVDKKQNVIDVHISSKQGIGGDDRCGVYAIFQMLKLGHRPSVLLCMGEEIGCLGSRKFCDDYANDFLNDINAFIQIDRHGNRDCVRYSDTNDKLTKAIEEFCFKFAYGTFTDISVLMPHFGISGVNLSSGYYHEHCAESEYISIKDVNHLLIRLNKILKTDIFKTRYDYMPYVPKFFERSFNSSFESNNHKSHNFEQLHLFDDSAFDEEDYYHRCDCCGELVDAYSLSEIDHPSYDLVCEDCANNIFLKQNYVRCPACSYISYVDKKHNNPKFVHHYCPNCGCELDDEDNI